MWNQCWCRVKQDITEERLSECPIFDKFVRKQPGVCVAASHEANNVPVVQIHDGLYPLHKLTLPLPGVQGQSADRHLGTIGHLTLNKPRRIRLMPFFYIHMPNANSPHVYVPFVQSTSPYEQLSTSVGNWCDNRVVKCNEKLCEGISTAGAICEQIVQNLSWGRVWTDPVDGAETTFSDFVFRVELIGSLWKGFVRDDGRSLRTPKHLCCKFK